MTNSNLMTIWAADPQTINGDATRRYSKRSTNWGWRTSMFGGEYNPDRLDYRVYNKMLKDPQIDTASWIIKNFLSKQKWDVTPASEDPYDIEVAAAAKNMLKRLNMRQARLDSYTAMEYGYAVSEKIFDYDMFNSQIVLKDLIPLHISTLRDCFEYDDYGKVKTVWQSMVENGPIGIPAWKCQIHTFREVFRNKYGRSILRNLYDTWFMKDKSIMWLMGFLEKNEGPTFVGIEGESSTASEMQANMDSIHDGTTSFTGKQGEVYQVLESQHRGEGFFKAIQYFDTVIFRTFFIGSLLLGQAENQGGSYNQSKTHMDTLEIALDGIHEDNATNWQETVNQYADFNYGVEDYPEFSFEPFTQLDLLKLLNALQPYAQNFLIEVKSGWFEQLLKQIVKQYAGIDISEEDLKQITQGNGFPQPSEDDLSEGVPEAHAQLLDNMGTVLKNTNPVDLVK